MSLFSNRVDYSHLNARQKENFNFQKVSAVLADHGFMTLRVSSDWQSADFIAQHIDGVKFLKVQLKGRFTIDEKYLGKELHICFPDRGTWYLCPHDDLMDAARNVPGVGGPDYWQSHTCYHRKTVPESLAEFLQPFALN